jgi:OOP family OmpA-OmpF porin
MRARRIAAIAALALAACGAASAADVYLGASAGASDWSIQHVPGAAIDGDDYGYKVAFGAHLNPYLAVELGWADLGQATLTGTGISGDLKSKGAFIDLVGMLQTTQDWWLLGRIGAFNGEVKGQVTGVGSASDRGTDLKFGLGAQFDVSKTVMLRAEWERYRVDVFGETSDVDLWSVGLSFRF